MWTTSVSFPIPSCYGINDYLFHILKRSLKFLPPMFYEYHRISPSSTDRTMTKHSGFLIISISLSFEINLLACCFMICQKFWVFLVLPGSRFAACFRAPLDRTSSQRNLSDRNAKFGWTLGMDRRWQGNRSEEAVGTDDWWKWPTITVWIHQDGWGSDEICCSFFFWWLSSYLIISCRLTLLTQLFFSFSPFWLHYLSSFIFCRYQDVGKSTPLLY